MRIRMVVPDRVWQGDRDAGEKMYTTAGIAEIGIRGVICSAHNLRLRYHESLPVLLLPVDDHDDVPPAMFDLAVEFHRRFGPTLVHCNGGKNRSVAFAAALAAAEGWTFDRAYAVCESTPTDELQQSLQQWRALHPEGW